MSRTKAKTNNHSHTLSVVGSYTGTSVPQPGPAPLRKILGLTDSCVYGDNVPGWKTKLRIGQGVITDLKGTRYKLKAVPGTIAIVWGPDPKIATIYQSGYTGCGSITVPPPDFSLDPNALSTATSRFLQSYISATNTFRGGNFAAEIKDSIELVLHPVKSIYKHTWDYAATVKKIGKVYAQKPKTAAALLSESWLAFSFGIKPFVQDANDAAAALNVISQGTRHDVRIVKGNATVRSGTPPGPFVWSGDLGAPNSGGLFAYQTTMKTKSVRFKAGIVAKPTGMGNLLNEFGVGVFDLAPAVWEGIPWSFFIDYFANVGEVLDAMRLWDANPAWVYRTIRNSVTQSFRPLGVPLSNPNSYQTREATGYIDLSGTFCQRGSVAIPYPKFRFKLPGSSPYRWLNITALIGIVNDSRWGSSKAPPLTLR